MASKNSAAYSIASSQVVEVSNENLRSILSQISEIESNLYTNVKNLGDKLTILNTKDESSKNGIAPWSGKRAQAWMAIATKNYNNSLRPLLNEMDYLIHDIDILIKYNSR